jgi:hypothetical protein
MVTGDILIDFGDGRVVLRPQTTTVKTERGETLMMTKKEFIDKINNGGLASGALLFIWGELDNGILVGRAGRFSRGGIYLFNNDILDPYGLKDDCMIEWTNERVFIAMRDEFRANRAPEETLNF